MTKSSGCGNRVKKKRECGIGTPPPPPPPSKPDPDKAHFQLPNEVLDKIIDFALTGTEFSVITTYIVPFVSLVIALNDLQVIISVGFHKTVTTIGSLHVMATIARASYAKNLAQAADFYWLLNK